jgi:hydrogenase maturation protein HypF
LLVDATNAAAVGRLRQRKRRPDRPFALMLPTLAETKRFCLVSAEEARELASHQSPIVLLRRILPETASNNAPNPSPLSSLPSPLTGVAPGNPYLGVMLPYTPLHHLLLAAVARPLVCTSGNLSEEPMAITIEDAIDRLGPLADALLTHNRPIVRPVDDSIVRIGPHGPQMLRRARGFAPLPINLAGVGPFVGEQTRRNQQPLAENKDLSPSPALPAILAVGGHLKNTVALLLGDAHRQGDSRGPTARGQQVVLSAHVGDLDSVASVDVFRRAVDDLLDFFQTTPGAVVCDLHPDYASTRHAEALAARWSVPLVRVQHHHAHVAACMAEHGLQGPVLGFSWDGTGYGPDATVWGGEALVCAGANYRRAAHLRTFALPGGDRASREPRRSALGLLFEVFGEQAKQYAGAWFRPTELDTLLSMLTRGVNAPRTSSMGRLFDAVAALCGLPPVISFEGQAAMALEFAAAEQERGSYPLPIQDESTQPLVADWAPLVHGVLSDRAAGVPISLISARFHNALADMALAVARSVTPELPIVLTGGCFQNALLADRVQSRLSQAGFQVYTNSTVPPGDGGIALGQVFVALQEWLGDSGQ